MSEPFLAEVRMVGFVFAPRGWAQCDGQILPINQNQSLYALLGTTYGGDGRTTFALPDLRSRTPIHRGDGFVQGQSGGEETHTLNAAETPAHTHDMQGSAAPGNTPVPANGTLAGYTGGYESSSTGTTDLRSDSILNSGGGQAHNNMQPYVTVNFAIALQGLFPSRN